MVDRIFNDIVQLYLQCDGGPAHLYRATVPVLVHYCQHHRDVLRGNIWNNIGGCSRYYHLHV